MDIKNRSQIILALLYAPGFPTAAIEGITRLQKLIFLISKETGLLKGKEDQPAFRPYKMGPFSEQIYDEVDFLKSLGLMEEGKTTEADVTIKVEGDLFFDDQMLDKYQKGESSSDEKTVVYSLSDKGQKIAKQIFDSLSDEDKAYIKNLKLKFGSLSLRQLLRHVYKKYPEYTTQSEIKEYLNL